MIMEEIIITTALQFGPQRRASRVGCVDKCVLLRIGRNCYSRVSGHNDMPLNSMIHIFLNKAITRRLDEVLSVFFTVQIENLSYCYLLSI